MTWNVANLCRRWFGWIPAALLLATTDAAAARTWTDTSGKTLTAELLRVDGDAAVFDNGGPELRVPLANLSAADQAFVTQWQSEQGGAAPTATTGSQTLPGGVELAPGNPTEFVLQATDQDRKVAEVKDLETIKVVVTVPKNFDPNGVNRFFIANDTLPGANAAKARSYGKTGAEHGFVVLGAESGDLDRDKHREHNARDACIRRALEELFALWPKAKTWPQYQGGFSGGSKNCFFLAAYIAKEFGIVPSGFFMAGCNQLMLEPSRNAKKVPKSTFRNAAYFLSNGTSDNTAPASGGEAIGKELRGMGMRKVRVETYDGGHSVNQAHFAEALDWFVAEESKKP